MQLRKRAKSNEFSRTHKANAGYGAISNAYFRYFDVRIAEAITLTGQASDRHLADRLNDYLNGILKTKKDYVVAGDTDSVYLTLDSLVKQVCAEKSDEEIVKFLDKLAEKDIQPKVINKSIDTIYNLCGCKTKVMSAKREAIASSSIFVGKKAYAMKVLNSEGVDYKPYKLKVMGLVMIKSQTPKLVRKWLKEALNVIFEEGELALQKYVKECKSKFMSSPVEAIAFPRGVSDIDKWYDPKTLTKQSCPIHVRASILYNHHTDEKLFSRIKNGDKIKFIYLMMPNTIKQNVIGWPTDAKFPLPAVEKYVDRELQWQKCFVQALEALCKPIGWEIEKTATLGDFFA